MAAEMELDDTEAAVRLCGTDQAEGTYVLTSALETWDITSIKEAEQQHTKASSLLGKLRQLYLTMFLSST